MADSAYASMSGAPRRSSKQTSDVSLQFTPMFSPSMSAVSYATHGDGNGFLPASGADSFAGNFESFDLPSQANLWPTNASAAPTPVSLDFAQNASPVAARRNPYIQNGQDMQNQHSSSMPHEGSSACLGQARHMPPASPEIVGQSTDLSRTSSRATMSGYISASGSSTGPHGSFGTKLPAAYGSAPMLCQVPSNMTSTSYMDGSVISPISPVLTVEHPASITSYQTQAHEDWVHDYLYLDNHENETPKTGLRVSTDDNLKLRDSSSEHRRASLDDENARSDPMYQATPDRNGEYHCPFVKSEGCDHEPVRLKCNYDKYIDSHLRPFRCRVTGCEDVPFSSTACLLRHQREAHAMHGHGHKPNLCLWQDCDRSKPGNGFPRRYNLLDHMKRVHGHNGIMMDDTPSTAGRRSSAAQGRVKAGRVEKSQRKPTKAELEAQARAKKEKEIQQIKSRFSQCKQTMLQQLSSMDGPEDQTTLDRIREGLVSIEKMNQRLAELG